MFCNGSKYPDACPQPLFINVYANKWPDRGVK